MRVIPDFAELDGPDDKKGGYKFQYDCIGILCFAIPFSGQSSPVIFMPNSEITVMKRNLNYHPADPTKVCSEVDGTNLLTNEHAEHPQKALTRHAR